MLSWFVAASEPEPTDMTDNKLLARKIKHLTSERDDSQSIFRIQAARIVELEQLVRTTKPPKRPSVMRDISNLPSTPPVSKRVSSQAKQQLAEAAERQKAQNEAAELRKLVAVLESKVTVLAEAVTKSTTARAHASAAASAQRMVHAHDPKRVAKLQRHAAGVTRAFAEQLAAAHEQSADSAREADERLQELREELEEQRGQAVAELEEQRGQAAAELATQLQAKEADIVQQCNDHFMPHIREKQLELDKWERVFLLIGEQAAEAGGADGGCAERGEGRHGQAQAERARVSCEVITEALTRIETEAAAGSTADNGESEQD